jgi:hypothetical protein
MTKRIYCAVLAFGLTVCVLGEVGTAQARARSEGSGGSTSITCLSSAAQSLWWRIQSVFPNVYPTSTCRPGARVRGTGGISRHASGNAIDFRAPGNKGAVVAWLLANHSGGVMTYSNNDHIHADIGPHWANLTGRKIAFGGGTSHTRLATSTSTRTAKHAVGLVHKRKAKAAFTGPAKRHKRASGQA